MSWVRSLRRYLYRLFWRIFWRALLVVLLVFFAGLVSLYVGAPTPVAGYCAQVDTPPILRSDQRFTSREHAYVCGYVTATRADGVVRFDAHATSAWFLDRAEGRRRLERDLLSALTSDQHRNCMVAGRFSRTEFKFCRVRDIESVRVNPEASGGSNGNARAHIFGYTRDSGTGGRIDIETRLNFDFEVEQEGDTVIVRGVGGEIPRIPGDIVRRLARELNERIDLRCLQYFDLDTLSLNFRPDQEWDLDGSISTRGDIQTLPDIARCMVSGLR